VEMFQLLRDVRWPTSPSRRADLIVVAPATAKPSASAHGLADTC
jgi:phosphopantothenoylcysteine synthetase/decarboxylase